MDPTTHARLLNALTDFDRKQSRTKHYNRYALGHYAKALQEAEADCKAGATIRQALLVNFSGKLRDTLLSAIGEPIATRPEEFATPTWPRDDIED